MMHSEEVLRLDRHEHGCRHVDQEGARCIDDDLLLMHSEEVLRLDRLEH